MFYAKPKMNSNYDAKEFEDYMDAVNYLNNYCMPAGGEDEVPKFKAEDWNMVGKLNVPEGFYFRDNKLLEMGSLSKKLLKGRLRHATSEVA